MNDVGQIFALKVGKQRPKPQNFDFEVLADVAVEFEKFKHIGPNPNVVHCYALVTDGVQHALVLPRAHCSLQDRLFQKDFIARHVRWRWLWEAFNGVSHLHRRAVLHFDIKPGNMLMFTSAFWDREDRQEVLTREELKVLRGCSTVRLYL